MTEQQPMPASSSERPAEYPDLTQPYNVFAVLAFVFVWLTIILGLVFGYIALAQIKRTNQQGRGLARAAVILGWIGRASTIIVLIVAFAAGWFTVSTPSG
jgi:hypothetical protein